jgi:2-polyprenyl-6-methoxyphenol hydroxylase-like FAD-dependent oxidoreductase
MESWNDITIAHRGERVTIDGVGFSAIGRLKLLQLLQARARSVGVEPVYRRTVKSLDELGDADLVVGTDGVNSLVRRGNEERFWRQRARFLSNRFAWFGTWKAFLRRFTQTFVETADVLILSNAHHYEYAPNLSDVHCRGRWSHLRARGLRADGRGTNTQLL